MTSEAQRAANKRQNQKRAGMPRVNLILSDDENRIFHAALKKSGDTKKGTIIEALRSYVKS